MKEKKKKRQKSYEPPSFEKYDLKKLKEGWKVCAFGRIFLDPECTTCWEGEF